MRIPFGRLMLFFLITAGLFGLFSSASPFLEFYKIISGFSLIAGSVSLVLWLVIALFIPGSLFMSGNSILGDSIFLSLVFEDLPWVRIAIISLVVSFVLSWVHSLVFPIAFTVFLVSVDLFLVRLLFFTYGSSS